MKPRAIFLSQWSLIAATSLLWQISSSPASADAQVAQAQEALRQQEFYFGKVSGAMDEETRAGLRRFQIRHGLPVSGEIDAATRGMLLGKNSTAAASSKSPEDRPSARERSQNLAQKDREFLDSLAASPAVDPVPVVKKELPPPQRREVAPPPVAELTRRPAPEPARIMEQRPAARPGQPTRDLSNGIRQFVRTYLDVAEGPSPKREVALYGDRVDYFDEGRIAQANIARDQAAYYRRWPERNFTLLDEPEVLEADADSALVRFRIRYEVRRGNDLARGRTENIMRLRNENGQWRIVGIRERKLR